MHTHVKNISLHFSLSVHNLYIEKGHYSGIERCSKICKCCRGNDIEDEYHFILVCPLYQELRQKFHQKDLFQ